MYKQKYVQCICEKCKSEFDVNCETLKGRKRKGLPNYCPKCMKGFISQMKKD